MDDAEYLFKQDCREKKITAHSANKKVRHTGCKLPSDFMTRREKKTLNGEVHIMNIHKPITYKYFKTLPKDLQEEFLQFLKDEFSCSANELQRKWGLSTSAGVLRRYCAHAGIKYPFLKGQKGRAKRDGRWDKFWAGEEWRKPENAHESHENDLDETNTGSECTDIPAENASESVENNCGEEHFEEATKKLKLVEQARETLAELESKIVANSPALKTCGRYGGDKNIPADTVAEETRTLDEVVLEQPFEVGSLSFNLKNIRDWESVIKALSAFPLPAHNSVAITVHALMEDDAQ